MRCTRLATTSTRHLLRARRLLLSVCLARLGKCFVSNVPHAPSRGGWRWKSANWIEARRNGQGRIGNETDEGSYENAKNENETVVAKRIELENSVTDLIQKQLVDALANMAKRRAWLKKEEVARRAERIESFEAKVISIDAEREQSGELAKIAETSTQYAKEQEKRDKRIAELAKRSKKNAILSRRETTPHDPPNLRNTKRDFESSKMPSHKLRETKRLFALYNSRRNEANTRRRKSVC